MKNQIKTGLIVAAAFTIGLGFNNFAMSGVPANFKVAVIDINKVVSQSSDVQALKKEQEAKMQDLQKWLETVRADVQKQSTKEGQDKLVKKYDADFAKKQEVIRKDYGAKLQAIDKSISGVIAKEAKAQGYDMVLAKGMVLYGGADITGAISKAVK